MIEARPGPWTRGAMAQPIRLAARPEETAHPAAAGQTCAALTAAHVGRAGAMLSGACFTGVLRGEGRTGCRLVAPLAPGA